MKLPLVSICCITYNHANFIKDAIEGFLAQKTDFPFEIIIHDDASTDGTTDIIVEYKNKFPEIIIPIFQTENQYSKGIRGITARFTFPLARGKYIALCEGDDYWTDEYRLQKQVDLLEKHKDCVATFSNVSVVNENDTLLINKKLQYHDKYKFNSLEVLNSLQIPTATLLFKRSALPSPYPKEFYQSSNGDFFLESLLSKNGDFIYNEEIFAVYRKHQGGIHSLQPTINNLKKMIETRILLLNCFHSRVEKRILTNSIKIFYLRVLFILKFNNNIKKLINFHLTIILFDIRYFQNTLLKYYYFVLFRKKVIKQYLKNMNT